MKQGYAPVFCIWLLASLFSSAPSIVASTFAWDLNVGIELQPPGVDQCWVRIWVLDRSAAPSARCRLVVRDAALRRAKELQAAHGAARCGGRDLFP